MAEQDNPNATNEQSNKRGPGRPSKAELAAREAANAEPIGVPVSEQVTYVPGDGDPTATTWGGIKFIANVPVMVTGHSGNPTKGECTPLQRSRHDLIEAAKSNKFFRVGGGKPAVQNDNGVPAREEDRPLWYRAHVVAWLKTIGRDPDQPGAMTAGCTEALIKHYADDRQLREMCGVGTDDYAYLGSLIDPKLAECQRADELNADQVRELWVKHGVMELPWR